MAEDWERNSESESSLGPGEPVVNGPDEEEEPDFSDPEGYQDSISNEG